MQIGPVTYIPLCNLLVFTEPTSAEKLLLGPTHKFTYIMDILQNNLYIDQL